MILKTHLLPFIIFCSIYDATFGVSLLKCTRPSYFELAIVIDCKDIEGTNEHSAIFDKYSDKSSENRNKTIDDYFYSYSCYDARDFKEIIKTRKELKIEFKNCQFPNIPYNFFQELGNVNEIKLDNSSVHNVDGDRLAANSRLRLLSMSQNNLTELSASLFSNTQGLGQIDFSYNNIKKIDPTTFNWTLGLIRLKLAHNLIEAIDEKLFEPLTILNFIDLSYNQLRTFLPELLHLKRLWNLNLSNNKINQLNCNIFANTSGYYGRITVDVSHNELQLIDLNCDRESHQLVLDIQDNFLENLTLPASKLMGYLDELSASGNKIKNISIESELQSLRYLNLSRNQLSDVSDVFERCISLISMDLSFNDIRDLNINSSIVGLSDLHLSNNKINRLGCNIFPNENWGSTSVDASKNQLKELDLNCDKRSKQITLNVEDNLLESLILPATTLVDELATLLASKNRIKQIIIEKELKSLKHLQLANNSITDLSGISGVFRHCSAVETFDLSSNDIQKLGVNTFVKMKKLRKLYLNNTSLQRIQHGTFSHTENLEILNLSHNNLIQFSFDSFLPYFERLGELYLNGNKIEDLVGWSNTILPNLRVLDISSNNLSCSSLIQFYRALNGLSKIHLEKEPTLSTVTHDDDSKIYLGGIGCIDREL